MTTRLDDLVHTIIRNSSGNRTLAQQMLVKEVLADDRLLRALVAPFMKSLAAATIDRVLRPVKIVPPAPVTPVPASESVVAKAALAAKLLGAGYNPMKAAQPERLGLTAAAKPPEASARHISTLKLLAAAYQVKKAK